MRARRRLPPRPGTPNKTSRPEGCGGDRPCRSPGCGWPPGGQCPGGRRLFVIGRLRRSLAAAARRTGARPGGPAPSQSCPQPGRGPAESRLGAEQCGDDHSVREDRQVEGGEPSQGFRHRHGHDPHCLIAEQGDPGRDQQAEAGQGNDPPPRQPRQPFRRPLHQRTAQRLAEQAFRAGADHQQRHEQQDRKHEVPLQNVPGEMGGSKR